jgi:hypothetical protein
LPTRLASAQTAGEVPDAATDSFPPDVANVVSLAALFVAMGGTATAVTYAASSNSQVGPNTISGHKPPTGDHAYGHGYGMRTGLTSTDPE